MMTQSDLGIPHHCLRLQSLNTERSSRSRSTLSLRVMSEQKEKVKKVRKTATSSGPLSARKITEKRNALQLQQRLLTERIKATKNAKDRRLVAESKKAQEEVMSISDKLRELAQKSFAIRAKEMVKEQQQQDALVRQQQQEEEKLKLEKQTINKSKYKEWYEDADIRLKEQKLIMLQKEKQQKVEEEKEREDRRKRDSVYVTRWVQEKDKHKRKIQSQKRAQENPTAKVSKEQRKALSSQAYTQWLAAASNRLMKEKREEREKMDLYAKLEQGFILEIAHDDEKHYKEDSNFFFKIQAELDELKEANDRDHHPYHEEKVCLISKGSAATKKTLTASVDEQQQQQQSPVPSLNLHIAGEADVSTQVVKGLEEGPDDLDDGTRECSNRTSTGNNSERAYESADAKG